MKIKQSDLVRIIKEEAVKAINERNKTALREMDENLGTFGGAVKNGQLRDGFRVEEVEVVPGPNGNTLKCHMGRWFGRDDELILHPDGTGENTDPNATDKNFRWTSIIALSSSIGKRVGQVLGRGALGAGAGAALGAGAGMLGKAAGGAIMRKGLGAGVRSKAAGLMGFGLNAGATANGLKLGAGALGTGAAIGAAGYGIGRAQANQQAAAQQAQAQQQQPQQQGQVNESDVDEFHPAAIGAIAGGVAGLGHGIYNVIQDVKKNIIYKADGTFQTKDGSQSGSWVEDESQQQAGEGEQQTQPGGQEGGGRTPNPRIQKLQQALNAGSWSYPNKPLKVDGILGPKTTAAAQKAGVDPKTWNGSNVGQNPELSAGAKAPIQGVTVDGGPASRQMQAPQIAEEKLRKIIRQAVISEIRRKK